MAKADPPSSGRPTAPAKIASLAAVFLLLAWWMASRSGPDLAEQNAAALQLQGRTMGTSWHATLVHPPADVDFQAVIQDALNQVDNRMSTYKPDSELSRFNAAPAGAFHDFSSSSLVVLRDALRLAERTEGAFDPTILPLIELWGFGAKEGESSPTEQQIAALLQQVGWRHLQIEDSGAVVKSSASLQVDLSATAKGFGVDQAANALMKAGCPNFLLEVGGELRTAGRKKNGEAWKVGIDRPVLDVTGQRSLQQVIEISDWAVATSGDYRNYREIDDKRVSHLVDPRTGYPITHNLASVTILAKDCMTADGLATAVSILGAVQGMQLLRDLPEVHAYLILREADDFKVLETTGFAQFKR